MRRFLAHGTNLPHSSSGSIQFHFVPTYHRPTPPLSHTPATAHARHHPTRRPPHPPTHRPAHRSAHFWLPRKNDDTQNTVELSHKEIVDKIGAVQLEQELDCGTIKRWLKPGTKPDMRIYVYKYAFNSGTKTKGTQKLNAKNEEAEGDEDSRHCQVRIEWGGAWGRTGRTKTRSHNSI